jgi:hypothetical protein
MIFDYNVITSDDLGALVVMVRDEIGRGWQPVGGICAVEKSPVTPRGNPHVVYMQAVTLGRSRIAELKKDFSTLQVSGA